jgi:hypothetical protein
MTVQAAPTAKRQTSPIDPEISATQCQLSLIKFINLFVVKIITLNKIICFIPFMSTEERKKKQKYCTDFD